jgi:hypothetical protein
MAGRIRLTGPEEKEIRKVLGEIFSTRRFITSPSSRLGGEQEFVLKCEELARQLYPGYKDAVLIKGSVAYACKLAGIRGRVVNVGGLAEIALTKNRADARKLRIARAHGCVEPYKQRALGLNFMLDELNAAVVAMLLRRELKKKSKLLPA